MTVAFRVDNGVHGLPFREVHGLPFRDRWIEAVLANNLSTLAKHGLSAYISSHAFHSHSGCSADQCSCSRTRRSDLQFLL